MTNEELVKQIRAEKNKAENMLALYEQNKGMIYQIAKKYVGIAELDDLTQEGYIGLCQAVDNYDITGEVSFVNYAWKCIQNHLLRYVRNEKNLSEYMHVMIWRYNKLKNTFKVLFGRCPMDWEYCKYLQISNEQLKRIRKSRKMRKNISMDSPMGEEDMVLSDTLASDVDIESDVLEEVQKEQLKSVLWSLVDSLPGYQGSVLVQRFQECKTLKETGENIGVSTERVRQIEKKALRELKKNKKLCSFGEEYIESKAMQGNSAARFEMTWTSSTERVALKLAE